MTPAEKAAFKAKNVAGEVPVVAIPRFTYPISLGPALQPTDARIAALEAKCKDYEAALRDTMQSLAWLSFGQARGYSDVLLTAQGAMDKGRAALAKHGGAA